MIRPPASTTEFILDTALTALALISMAVTLVIVLAVIGWLWRKVRRMAISDADQQFREHVSVAYPIDPDGWKQ